jgi:hypothetical protein
MLDIKGKHSHEQKTLQVDQATRQTYKARDEIEDMYLGESCLAACHSQALVAVVSPIDRQQHAIAPATHVSDPPLYSHILGIER